MNTMKILNNCRLAWLIILYYLIYYGLLVSFSVAADAVIHTLAHERDVAGFISIDCGMVEDQRYDSDTGFNYSSDVGFIETGTNRRVGVQFIRSYLAMYNTLRSFPDGTRNCYTLRASQGNYGNYLIRASFHYGNYDGLNNVPQFDVYMGVNYWVTVELPSVDHTQFYELIFAPPQRWVYLCLVNTGSGTPFISGIELRPLNNSIYRSATGALMLNERLDAGWSTTDSTHYYCRSDDPYDREWSAVQTTFAVWRSLSPNISFNSTFADAYRLPPSVLKTAAVPLHDSGSLVFNWNYSLIGSFQVYWHFAELKRLGISDLREFTIFMSGNYQSGKIIPKYKSPSTIVSPVTKFNGSSLEFSITRTRNSTLPPILNALEIYKVLDTPASVTYQDDVDAMMDIKRNYRVSKTWQGDPCLPYTPWDGLNCSSSNNVYDSPRITCLNLAFSGLTGEVPHSLSMLTSLVYLNLSYNSLTGFIPDFLAELPSLHMIDLRSNKLTGRIPIALTKKVEDGSLHLSVDGNPDLRVSNPSKKKILKKIGAILGTAASIILIFAAIVVFYRYTRKKKAGNIKRRSLKSESSSFTYCEVVNMTNNFQRIIGRGGSGTVYHGCLQDGTPVAVKLLNPSSKHSLKLFRTEAQLLTRVHHRNLVSLLGYSEEGITMALIYEHVANGSLQQHLSETNFTVLSWKVRLQIAIDAAHGLEYMHSGCEPPILHRDMKTSNILLDEKMQAKISDFGISRAFSADTESSLTTDVVGTHGYLDPEYCYTHRISKRSDVYSFGVVLLELISGRRAIVRIRNTQPIHISAWVAPMLERGDIDNIVDKRLQGNFSSHSAWKALEIAMVCVSSIAIKRPCMTQVLVDLDDCLAIEVSRGGDTHSNHNEYAYSSYDDDVDILITDSQIGRAPWAR